MCARCGGWIARGLPTCSKPQCTCASGPVDVDWCQRICPAGDHLELGGIKQGVHQNGMASKFCGRGPRRRRLIVRAEPWTTTDARAPPSTARCPCGRRPDVPDHDRCEGLAVDGSASAWSTAGATAGPPAGPRLTRGPRRRRPSARAVDGRRCLTTIDARAPPSTAHRDKRYGPAGRPS